MIVSIIHIWVKDEFLEKFIEATIENHENSIKEEGNLRFDILQDVNDPSKFVLYEVFINEEAVKKHKETLHYKKWKESVENWMKKPRESFKYKVIRPLNNELWR